jgi:hypothetical protein
MIRLELVLCSASSASCMAGISKVFLGMVVFPYPLLVKHPTVFYQMAAVRRVHRLRYRHLSQTA